MSGEGWRTSTPVQQGMGCVLMGVAVAIILLALGALAWISTTLP